MHRLLILVLRSGILAIVLIFLFLFGADIVSAEESGIREFTLGVSGQGRPITVVQIGNGPRKLVVVGDTHGGPEANTYRLTLELIDYFRVHPQEVPAEIRLYLIPSINPDGLALESRFNASNVDLNRNMNTNLDNCPENDWKTTVYGAYGLVSDTGGPFAESEVESQLIRNFLLDASGAIFLHSNAGLVFPAYCEHQPSIDMAQVYAQAADYEYARVWPGYMINGGMHDWAGSMGIAAITPELWSPIQSEFSQNLAGLQAVLAQPETLLPLPEDRIENDIVVPAVIWRYWKSLGGEHVFGLPIQAAQLTDDGVTQLFGRTQLTLRLSQADTPSLVQPASLGIQKLESLQADSHFSVANLAIRDQNSDYTLQHGFHDFWLQHGAEQVFGMPLSDELEAVAADGQQRTLQYLERAVFAYYPEDGTVRPEPLGWQQLLQEQVMAPWMEDQIR